MIAEIHQNLPYLLFQLAAKFFIGCIIGYFLGRNRVIGIWWTAFFSITFWPVGALIIVLVSPKIAQTELTTSKVKKIIGWVFMAIGLFTFYAISASMLENTPMRSHPILLFTLIAGVIGSGLYLILRGSGKSFHQQEAGLR